MYSHEQVADFIRAIPDNYEGGPVRAQSTALLAVLKLADQYLGSENPREEAAGGLIKSVIRSRLDDSMAVAEQEGWL